MFEKKFTFRKLNTYLSKENILKIKKKHLNFSNNFKLFNLYPKF